jgi:2-methylcitrate dehydratase PrpD
VVTRAKHIVMDAVAVILAGRDTRRMYNITLDHMAPAGDVTPVGCDFKTTAAMAAFTNALNAQTHDYNDGLNNSGMLGGAYHPGRTVVSTALAVGQQVHASGKDILLAVVLGIEAAARMRNPAHGSLIADCYSSAVTAAKLMGADAGQFRSACALAADLCVAQKSKTIPGYSTSVTNGKGASAFMNALKYAFLNRSSIEAAELAMLGYEGNTLNDNLFDTYAIGEHKIDLIL